MLSARWAPCLVWMCALALLLGAATQAGAEENQEEYEFGKGLLKRHWFDMAQKVFRDLTSSGASQDLRNKGELGLIDVLKTQAEAEEDPELKKKLFDEAISKYKNFLKGNTDPQALFNLAELLKSKGTDFTTQIRLSTDEEEKKTLIKEAHDAFEEAVGLVKNFLDKINEKKDKVGMEGLSEEEQNQRRNAMFNHADLHYLMAQVFEGSKEKKVEILRKADLLFEEFIWDYEDYGQAYLAYIQRGRCAVEMEEYGMALDLFATVLLVPLPEDASPAQRTMRDRLRILAYYRILEALVLAKKYEDAVARAEQVEQEFPNLIEDSFADPFSGRAAVLEKAKALAGLGRISEAIQEAVRVVDKGGYYMQVGMKLLGEWVAQDPKAGVRIVLLQAEGLYRTMKFERAIVAYQNAIDKIETDEERKEFGATAWMDMGNVYAARELYYEAGLAFQEGERVAQIFVRQMPRSTLSEDLQGVWDQAAENAYKAYRAFKLAYDESKSGRKESEFLKRLYSDQRNFLTTRYTDSVYAKNLSFFAGQDLLRQGRNLEAVSQFMQVEKRSDFYETALVGIGQAYFKEYDRMKGEEEAAAAQKNKGVVPADFKPSSDALDYLGKSEQNFNEFIQLANTKTVEGDEAVNRRRTLFGYTYFFLGRIHSERHAWEKVLETLKGFEEDYKDKPDLVLTASFLKLQAFYKLGKAREVEDMLRVMEEVDDVIRSQDKSRTKRHQYVIMGYQYAGAIYGDLAAQAKKNHEPEAYQMYNEKAAMYLWTWVQNDILADLESADPAQAVNRLDAVGIKQFKSEEYDKAAMIYKIILEKLGDVLNPDQQMRYKRAMGDCYMKQEKWDLALEIYKELYEANDKKLFFVENLVECYTKLGDRFRDAGDVPNANLNYDEALKLYQLIMRKDEPEKRQWWEWKYAVWSIMLSKGEAKDVVKQIQNAELLYPMMGGPDLKGKIKKLQDDAKELAGRR